MTRSSSLSHSALLLAALSHELGSPLAAIKGAATTLIDYRQRLPDDRITGFLHSIDQQTDHLNALLDDLVLMAKIEAGTLRLQSEHIALRAVLGQAIDQFPSDQYGNFLIEGSAPQVMADAPYLRQALALLLQHLRESSNTPTSIRLETSTMAHIRLSGPIDPELNEPLAHIDQLVNSTDVSRGRQAVTLLRLALCRAMIELHGGQWGVEQRSGDEPVLCITLPLAHQDGDAD